MKNDDTFTSQNEKLPYSGSNGGAREGLGLTPATGNPNRTGAVSRRLFTLAVCPARVYNGTIDRQWEGAQQLEQQSANTVPSQPAPPSGRWHRKRPVIFIAGFLVPALILIFRPLGLDTFQAVVLAGLVLVITWWVSKVVHRVIASCVLLLLFCIFGRTPLPQVFTFPLSSTFVIILLSFLFSQGVANSGLAEKLINPLLGRLVKNKGQLILAVALCAFLFIFIIPQPYSRVILLSIIFGAFCDGMKMGPRSKSIVLFALFAFSFMLNLSLKQGDIILNTAALSIAEVELTDGQWAGYMLLPTLVFVALAALLFYLVYRKQLELPAGGALPAKTAAKREPLTKTEKRNLALIGVIVVFWALTPLHGVNELYTIIIGTVLMFPFGLLRGRDFKTIDVPLLVFLTAAFAIGGVMKGSGVADILFDRFIPLFPPDFSIGFVLAVVGVTMALHMILGSNITTMSVMIPGLFTVAAGRVSAPILMFLIFFIICSHFILPFHNVIVMVGEGRRCYDGNMMLRFTLPLTALVIAAALLLYLPWWQLAGFL